MIRILKKYYLIFIVFILAIILRQYFAFSKTHQDLLTQSEWGRQAYSQGTLKEYYDWTTWNGSNPNHPPLISSLYFIIYPLHSNVMWMLSNLGSFIALHRLAPTKFIWLFNFAIWFGTKTYEITPILSGIIFTLKQFMILADLAIGLLIFYLCQKTKNNWGKFVLIYLFSPFSWYLSSSWGQSDQLSFIFLIISFILIDSNKYSVISPTLFAISANLKPNGILLLPVYLYYWYQQRQSLKNLVFGGIVATIFSLWTVSWFTNQNVLVYTLTVLPNKLNTSGGLTNYNAFNFWYIFHPFTFNRTVLDSHFYFIFSAKVWGWLLTIITTVLSFKVIKSKKIDSVFSAIFISGFGSWLFMTGMHERYSFLAITPVLLLSIYRHKYLKYFIILSTIYTLNMFIAYWPWQNLNWVNDIFNYHDFLFPRLLSFVNILIYFKVTYSLLKDNHTT